MNFKSLKSIIFVLVAGITQLGLAADRVAKPTKSEFEEKVAAEKVRESAPEFLPAIMRKLSFEKNVDKFYPAPDGSCFVVQFADDTSYLFDADMKCRSEQLNGLYSVTWSSDSAHFVAQCSDGKSYLYDASTGKVKSALVDGIHDVSWHKDSHSFIVRFGKKACIYDTTGKKIKNDTWEELIIFEDGYCNEVSPTLPTVVNGRIVIFQTASNKDLNACTKEQIEFIKSLYPLKGEGCPICLEDLQLYSTNVVDCCKNNLCKECANWINYDAELLALNLKNSLWRERFAASPDFTGWPTPKGCPYCRKYPLVVKSFKITAKQLDQEQTIILNQLRKDHSVIACCLESNYQLVPYQAPVVVHQAAAAPPVEGERRTQGAKRKAGDDESGHRDKK